MNKIVFLIIAAAVLPCSANFASAQETDVTPDKEIVAEQYLLVGTPTRGCGESQVAVNALNPNQIAVAAMCIINTEKGKWEQTEEEFTHTPRATITKFAFTRDRGLTWTLMEDPMRDYFRRYRCLDPFAAFTIEGTMILGCEAHFPIYGTVPDDEINKAVYNTRQHMGGSTLIYSRDGGHTFSSPIQIISSFMPKEVLGPFVSFAPIGSQGDRPEIRVDRSNGKIYVDGKSSAADPPHRQTVVRMSDDGGTSWRMVYAFDAAEWPQAGGSGYDVANGMMGVAYIASAVPASLNAKCPCRVFGISTDDGKTFDRTLIPAPVPAPAQPGGGGFGPGGMTVVGHPAKKGTFTVLIASSSGIDPYITEDSGKTWTKAASLQGLPNTNLMNLTAAYSPKGIMALTWRAVTPMSPPAPRVGPPRSWHEIWKFSDMPEHFDIWSAISRDGGKTFSAPFKVNTAPSPGVTRRRGMHDLGRDYISAAVDDDFVHMTWFDDRAGFRATWYGRVPLADYK
jgi:hypothetical protein